MPSDLRIEPLAGYLGAEIRGAELTREPDAALADRLRALLWEHQVLVFPGQFLDIPAQKRLTEVFGSLQVVPYVTPSAEDPAVIAVLKEADERRISVFGGDWHSDFSFLEQPPAGSLLSAVEVPPFGGDTLWSSQVAAWETLPEELRAQVRGRRAIHSGAPYGRKAAAPPGGGLSRSIGITRGDPEADRETLHPLVRRHPESGSEALFVNPIYTRGIEGLAAAEAAALLDRLYRHATRPDFTCRHRWRAGDLVIWDNRTTLHYAINDYDGHRRLLHRTTFAGERPQGPAA